jgi:hypothetical protein
MPQLGTWSRPDSPRKLVAALDLALKTAAGVGRSAAEPSTVVETVTAGRTTAAPAADPSPPRTAATPAGSTQITTPPSRPAILGTGAAAGAAVVLLAWTSVGLVRRRRSP